MNNGDDGSNADATESEGSVYARNRAVYEASLAAQQPQVVANGNGTLPAYNFEKQARPRSNSPDKMTDDVEEGDASGQPARKKLVRAGDLAAMSGSQETGPPADSNGVATSGHHQQESMREKIARATRGGSSGSHVLGSPAAFSPTTLQHLRPSSSSSNPSSNPFVAQPTYSPPSNGQGEIEMVIEVNARAFVSKNPGLPIGLVKSALKHSKGVFDQNFTTALKLLMQSHSPAVSLGQPPTSVSPQLAPGLFSGQSLPAGPQPQQQPTPAAPSARYPGQNSAPQQSPPYPGSAAFQTMQQQQQQIGGPPQQPTSRVSPVQQQNYPHQQGPVSSQNINGQSATSLGGQQYYPGQVPGQGPTSHSAQISASGQTLMHPPPPLLPGTHPQLGFSALQVLPQNQHAQFLQLAPSQQVEYSASVFASLGAEQKNQYTVQAQAQARMRDSWNRQQQQQQQNGGVIVIPPGGRGAGQTPPVNPYVGYASQLPTQQQQLQQQRFPGQNPVFRVGATQQAVNQQPSNPQQAHAQQAYLNEQFRLILATLQNPQRAQLLSLPHDHQMQWVHQHLQLRMEHQKRAAQQQARLQQQQMMADKHQEHKQTKSVGKKKRKRNYSDSDDEDDLNLHDTSDEDNDDEDANGGDASEAEGEREVKGIQWFNTTSVEELMEMTGGGFFFFFWQQIKTR